MEPDPKFRYGFQPKLPISEVRPGTNFLVSGSSTNGAREIALDLVTSESENVATLIVSADVEGQALLEYLEDGSRAVDRSMLGVVDCSEGSADEDKRFSAHDETISGPGDLTALEMEFSILYEKLVGLDPDEIRIGLISLSPLLAHAPIKEVSRFLHMLTGRIIATGDLGVFVVDSTKEDPETVETMSQFCDGHVEVRETTQDRVELRVSGLPDQPTDWTPVEYDVPLDRWTARSAEPE